MSGTFHTSGDAWPMAFYHFIAMYRLGSLRPLRYSVIRLPYRPSMYIAVYRGSITKNSNSSFYQLDVGSITESDAN